MKIVYLQLTFCITMCKCNQIPEATAMEHFVPVINLGGVDECIVFIQELDNDADLLKSLFTELYSDQSVLLTSGKGYREAERVLQSRDPNVVFFTDNLSIEDLDPHVIQVLMRSYWSPLNIIFTTKNGNLTCQNGIFNKTFYVNLQEYMNTIWQRHQIIFAIVMFPYTCPEQFVIYSGKKQSNQAVYDRTIKIIHAKDKEELRVVIVKNFKIRQLTEGYPLRANVFSRFPTSITQCDVIDNYINLNYTYTSGFCGMDGMMMHEFIDYYNYKFIIPSNNDCNKYGYVDPETNNATGSLGCILRKELDISFNSRFMVQYTKQYYFYLHYVSMDALAVVLKRPDVIPLWKYAVNLFGIREDLILSILIIILGVVAWASAWITRGITGKKPKILFKYILNALTCTFFGFAILKSAERFKILKGTSLFCSVIFLAYYQGIVNYQFTTTTRHNEIRTLEQLYKSQNTLYTSPQMLTLLMNLLNPDDQSQVDFFKHTKIKSDKTVLDFVLNHPHSAVLSRALDSKLEVILNYTDELGSPMLYVVDEAFHTYYLSYICRSDFLFIEESVRFMMQMLQAGLPNKFYTWTRQSLKAGDVYPKTGPEPRPFKAIELPDLRVAYTVLIVGYLMSTISFLLEMYKQRGG